MSHKCMQQTEGHAIKTPQGALTHSFNDQCKSGLVVCSNFCTAICSQNSQSPRLGKAASSDYLWIYVASLSWNCLISQIPPFGKPHIRMLGCSSWLVQWKWKWPAWLGWPAAMQASRLAPSVGAALPAVSRTVGAGAFSPPCRPVCAGATPSPDLTPELPVTLAWRLSSTSQDFNHGEFSSVLFTMKMF